jgi:hypothetical protein
MCDRDILQSDVELLCTLEQVAADAVGDGLTLGDELCGVELGDNSFEDFVSDGGEDTLVIVLTEVLHKVSCKSTCVIALLMMQTTL